MSALIEPGDPARPLEMHTIAYGGTARAFMIFGGLFVLSAVPSLLEQTAAEGPAFLLPLLLLVAVGYFQLRGRPKIYGSTAGIELVWPWGERRHFELAEIVQVEREHWGSTAFGVQYVLRHRAGSLRFYARAGFAEQVSWLKERAREGSL